MSRDDKDEFLYIIKKLLKYIDYKLTSKSKNDNKFYFITK